MPLIRPELKDALTRWREVLIALGVAGFGLWLISLGGWLFFGLGTIAAAIGAALACVGWRRLRFRRDGSAPGVVQVTEGQITYFSPTGGGFAALSELREISLTFDAAGRPQWRLAQVGEAALIIPAGAKGAEALFDTFVALPRADPARFLDAIERKPTAGAITVWRRAGRLALT